MTTPMEAESSWGTKKRGAPEGGEGLSLDAIREVIKGELSLNTINLQQEISQSVNKRMDTVEEKVGKQLERTLEKLAAMTDTQAEQSRVIAAVQAEQKETGGRLTQLEQKVHQLQLHGGSSTADTEGGGHGMKQPALILGGWPDDSPATETLEKAKDMMNQLRVDLDMEAAFCPGVRRGYVIIPYKARPNETGGELRDRLQQALRRVRTANIAMGRKDDGGTKYLWMQMSQSPERRRRAHLAGKVKRLILSAAGGPVHGLEVEWPTGEEPTGSTEGSDGEDPSPEPQSTFVPLKGVDCFHLATWNVGGLTADGTLDLLRTFGGAKHLCMLHVIMLQEIITNAGKFFKEKWGWKMVYGKQEGEFRGEAIAFRTEVASHTQSAVTSGAVSTVLRLHTSEKWGLLSGHIPHHATIPEVDTMLHHWGEQPALKTPKAAIGMDANEQFTAPRTAVTAGSRTQSSMEGRPKTTQGERKQYLKQLVELASAKEWPAYREHQRHTSKGDWIALLLDAHDWQAALLDHFSSIFTKADGGAKAAAFKRMHHQLTTACKQTAWRPFTRQELLVVSSRWGKHKSTGVDNIAHEALQLLIILHPIRGERVLAMLNEALYTGKLPALEITETMREPEGQIVANICSIALAMLAQPGAATRAMPQRGELPHEADCGALREAFNQITSMRVRRGEGLTNEEFATDLSLVRNLCGMGAEELREPMADEVPGEARQRAIEAAKAAYKMLDEPSCQRWGETGDKNEKTEAEANMDVEMGDPPSTTGTKRKWIGRHGVTEDEVAALETDSFLADLGEVEAMPTLPLPTAPDVDSADAETVPWGDRGKRPAQTDDDEGEKPLSLNTFLAALKDNREEIVAQVREDMDSLANRVSTVELTVDTHVSNTTKLLEAMTDRHCAMEESVRKVDSRQGEMMQRLELLEGKLAKATFSLSSTRTSESEGGNPRPALVVGGWDADQHHEETLKLVKQHLVELNVNLDVDKAFVPGLRRGFALVPLTNLEGETGADQRTRVQEVLRTVLAAKIITGQRPEGGNRYFFAALSQSPERRRRAQLAGKVKRLIIEEGGDPRRIDVEYGTANLWYNSVKIASRVTSAPDKATTEKERVAILASDPQNKVHVISWNVGGLTSAKVLDVLLALRRHGIRPFSESLIVLIQEVICEAGLGAFSIHIPHHATLSITEQILQGVHNHTTLHNKAVIGMDANETFSSASQNKQIKAATARGELLLDWLDEERFYLPPQELQKASHFPYNTELLPRRLDYIFVKRLLCDSGEVLAHRDVATSDREPVFVPLAQLRLAAETATNPAAWSARQLLKGDKVDRILDREARVGGDPVAQLQKVAVAITKPGKKKVPFVESANLREVRRQALVTPPGTEVAELDWGMKKALLEQSRDHSWEVGLTEDENWRHKLREHFDFSAYTAH
ncbi:unnamed protein product [Symbiodinium sp. CCMP2592]|nr:unnamed protein product [Symbiodinium sp. CCMP2592]